jgi:hypothetical protein
MSPTAFLASAVAGRALHFAIVATLIALWGERVMFELLSLTQEEQRHPDPGTGTSLPNGGEGDGVRLRGRSGR